MREIKVKPLTLENFKKYGSFSKMINPAGDDDANRMQFFADREVMELGNTHMAAFSTTRVTNALPPVIVAIEQHAHCGEGILSLDGDMIVYFAPAQMKYPAVLDHVEAFIIPQGTFVTIRPGVWHCMPFTLNTKVINVLNVLPERTYANDCVMNILKEEERIRIAVD